MHNASFAFKWSGRQDLNLQPLGPKPNALPSWATSRFNGAPNRSRTHNLLIRSQMLYPIELWARLNSPRNRFNIMSLNLYYLTKWWLQLESNQRHQDFQSCALPTELWSHMAVPTGLEPAIPRVTGECDNHYTTEPFGCGRWIWTNDLWVMSPTSYRTALSRDLKIKWRRKRDSNPCADFSTSRFSRPVPSTRLGYSSKLVPQIGLEPIWAFTLAGF